MRDKDTKKNNNYVAMIWMKWKRTRIIDYPIIANHLFNIISVINSKTLEEHDILSANL